MATRRKNTKRERKAVSTEQSAPIGASAVEAARQMGLLRTKSSGLKLSDNSLELPLNRSAIRRARGWAFDFFREGPGTSPQKYLVQMAASADGIHPSLREAWVAEVFAEVERLNAKMRDYMFGRMHLKRLK